jgi:hypothetical protein
VAKTMRPVTGHAPRVRLNEPPNMKAALATPNMVLGHLALEMRFMQPLIRQAFL